MTFHDPDCSFDNHGYTYSHCINSDVYLVTGKAPQSEQETSKRGLWRCSVCTYDNDEGLFACDICGVLNPSKTGTNIDKQTGIRFYLVIIIHIFLLFVNYASAYGLTFTDFYFV